MGDVAREWGVSEPEAAVRLKPGGDCVMVFDPETVADTVTYDRPQSLSRGIERVYVNGALAWRGAGEGEPRVLACAGRMLTRAAG